MTSGAARGRMGANTDTRSPSASSKKAQGASLRGTFPSCPGGCLDLVPACVSSWFGGCLKPAEDDTCSYPSACWSIVYANSCDGVVHSMCKSTRELKNRFCAVRVALHSLSLQCKLHLMIAPGKLYSRIQVRSELYKRPRDTCRPQHSSSAWRSPQPLGSPESVCAAVCCVLYCLPVPPSLTIHLACTCTGEKREMKFALESYWAKKSSEQELRSVGNCSHRCLRARGPDLCHTNKSNPNRLPTQFSGAIFSSKLTPAST